MVCTAATNGRARRSEKTKVACGFEHSDVVLGLVQQVWVTSHRDSPSFGRLKDRATEDIALMAAAMHCKYTCRDQRDLLVQTTNVKDLISIVDALSGPACASPSTTNALP